MTKDEVKESLQRFIKYAYKQINRQDSGSFDNADLDLFQKNFQNLPISTKKEILNNFKNLSPYDYDFIVDFLKGMEA